ncbi:MAG: DUF1573 domain-containing protein [Bacteroidia bacterium]|nr:DUF1573 domain-containing protein [Bacteroidia bacterium]
MKTIKLSTIALALCLMSFAPLSKNESSKGYTLRSVIKTSIKWNNTEINLGDIPQNKPVTIEYEFTNTGDSPVIITSVQASCGCTATDYSKTPVAPGEKTKIKAVFNAAAKGAFKKQVTVITSADQNPQILTFTGTVI